MAKTYDPIATQTLSSASSAVSFTSIPQTYTNLVLIINAKMTSAADAMTYTINGDTTGTNYAHIGNYGDGSSYGSYYQNLNTMGSVNSTSWNIGTIHFLKYSSSNYRKFIIGRTGSTATDTRQIISNYTASNSAITSLTIGTYSSSFIAGSTFSIYGVKEI